MPTNEELYKSLAGVEEQAKGIQAGLATLEKPAATTDFTSELQKKLMSNLDIVSSEPTELERTITGAMTGLEEARETTETGIKAFYERQRIEAGEVGARTLTGAEESRRGFATSTAYLAQIEGQTEKSLRDLDLREQEALASGRMEFADKIANLKIKTLEFQQNARQQAFTNLLQMGQFGLQMAGAEREAETTKFNRAISTVNLLKDFDLTGAFAADKIKEVESTLSLKSGSLNRIMPKADEKLDFYATDNAGNVTAIYRDTKTNKITTKTFPGIGGVKTEGAKIISQSTLNQLGLAGVAENVATGIQSDLNAAVPPEQIIVQLEKDNPGKGQYIWDTFKKTMEKQASWQALFGG